jgi:hypothetical protein
MQRVRLNSDRPPNGRFSFMRRLKDSTCFSPNAVPSIKRCAGSFGA